MEENCDLLGKNMQSLKSTTMESCQATCIANSNCLGAVFISGWNQCFLKSKVKRKVTLVLKSALREGVIQIDYDFSGKDLRQLDKANAALCQLACQQTKECKGFTYLEGYRSCWIKSTHGKLFKKIFYCYEKNLVP